MKFNKIHLLLFSVFILFFSCNECEPIADGSNEIKIAFFDVSKPIENSNDFESLKVKYDSILVVGYSETLLVTEDSLTSVTLPLSPEKTTTFIFMLGNTTDSLTVNYQRNINVDTPDCGISEEIFDLEISNPTSFQEAMVIRTMVDFSGQNNITILK